jgi:putative aminopeptidase FrvX
MKKFLGVLATVAVVTALLVVAAAIMLYNPAVLAAQTRREEVATRGAKVMPFNLEQTMHIFQKLDDGGLQKVVVKDP